MKNEKIFNAVGKISDELIEDALITTGKKTHAAVWWKWAAVAACLCLAIAAFIVPKLQNNSMGPAPQLSTNPSIGIEQPNNQDSTMQPNKKNVLLVSSVNGIAIADMDARLTHYPDLSESDDILKQFETAIGFSYNDFIAKIPVAFINKSFYSMDVPADAARTEYIPHDYIFGYQTETGGDIKIAICAEEIPLRDCFYICENPKQSEINGTSVVILGSIDNFLVQFSWENVNYDIETSNITLEELEHLLVSIIS